MNIVLTRKVMAPRNVKSATTEGYQYIEEAVNYFKMACKATIGYRQIEAYYRDRGITITIQIVPEEKKDVSIQTTSLEDLLSVVTMEEKIQSVGFTKEEAQTMISGSQYDEQVVSEFDSIFDALGMTPTLLTFKGAVLRLQVALFESEDIEKGKFDMQLAEGMHRDVQYPKAKGTYKLSRVANKFYKEHKDNLSPRDQQSMIRFLTDLNDQFIELCTEVVSNKGNYWFVSTHNVTNLPAFKTVLGV